MIWMFCGYLVFKGVQIFQLLFVSARDEMSRRTGITLVVVMIIVASFAAVGFFLFEGLMAGPVQTQLWQLPTFR